MYVPKGAITVPVQPITKPVWKPSFRGQGGSWGSKTYQKFLKEITQPLADACKDIDILWEPLEVWLDVRPKSPKSSKFPFPQGDVDNFSKAILDACTDVLWIDDWQIQDEHIHKEWAEPDTDGYFKVSWRVLPVPTDKWVIFNERKVQWELANEQE
jgi:Holliday junction resolvase RusA-like endonuclease